MRKIIPPIVLSIISACIAFPVAITAIRSPIVSTWIAFSLSTVAVGVTIWPLWLIDDVRRWFYPDSE